MLERCLQEDSIVMRAAIGFFVACFFAGYPAAASAQGAAQPSRGELLYTTHCIACHTTEIHWRQKKLAVDWESLERQVRRWAGNAGLAWTDADIAEVARYLNATYYRYAAPSLTRGGSDDITRRMALATRLTDIV